MRLTLVRHATLLVELGGRRLLVDPMLDEAGARAPIGNTPNPVPNPTVGLPLAAEDVVRDLDGIVVTHLHADHLDETAVRVLPRGVPVLCHCVVTRDELEAAAVAAGVDVLIPEDGETLEL